MEPVSAIVDKIGLSVLITYVQNCSNNFLNLFSIMLTCINITFHRCMCYVIACITYVRQKFLPYYGRIWCRQK